MIDSFLKGVRVEEIGTSVIVTREHYSDLGFIIAINNIFFFESSTFQNLNCYLSIFSTFMHNP